MRRQRCTRSNDIGPAGAGVGTVVGASVAAELAGFFLAISKIQIAEFCEFRLKCFDFRIVHFRFDCLHEVFFAATPHVGQHVRNASSFARFETAKSPT